MYEYFGGVTPILVPDNCSTAVNHNINRSDWYTVELHRTYHEMAEHYNTAVLSARVREPKDKPNVERSVGKISTCIPAALRNEQFFSLEELNGEIRKKLDAFNARKFQKKECSRIGLFLGKEKSLLAPLPATPFELAEWKLATVQFNYHSAVTSLEKYCTKPELEMLFLLAEGLEKDYEKVKSTTKPKDYAKEHISIGKKKYDNSTAFYTEYFGSTPKLLVECIKKYHQHNGSHNKDEHYLDELLK